MSLERGDGWPSSLDFSDPGVAIAAIETWLGRYREGADDDLHNFLSIANAINNKNHQYLPNPLGALGDGLASRKLTRNSVEMLAHIVREVRMDAASMKSLISATERGGEHPRVFLVNSIRAAMVDQSEDRLAAIGALTDRLGANEVIILDHGLGNVLYHAISLAHRLHVATFDNLAPILERLIQCGASVYVRCEDVESFMGKGSHPSLLDWLGRDLVAIQWWAERSLDMLLDLGCGWGSLDQRDDAVGRQVRNHPAWRKQHLAGKAEKSDRPPNQGPCDERGTRPEEC